MLRNLSNMFLKDSIGSTIVKHALIRVSKYLKEKPSPLLAGSVPDLQFDLLSINLDSLDHKVDAYGCSLPRREHALKVTFQDMKKQRGDEFT